MWSLALYDMVNSTVSCRLATQPLLRDEAGQSIVHAAVYRPINRAIPLAPFPPGQLTILPAPAREPSTP